MTTIEKLLIDMTDMYRTTGLKSEYYAKILDKIKEFQPLIQQDKPKTVITYNEADGLRIEHPIKEGFTLGQRFALAVIKWVAIIVVVAVVLKGCAA